MSDNLKKDILSTVKQAPPASQTSKSTVKPAEFGTPRIGNFSLQTNEPAAFKSPRIALSEIDQSKSKSQ